MEGKIEKGGMVNVASGRQLTNSYFGMNARAGSKKSASIELIDRHVEQSGRAEHFG